MVPESRAGHRRPRHHNRRAWLQSEASVQAPVYGTAHTNALDDASGQQLTAEQLAVCLYSPRRGLEFSPPVPAIC